MAKKKKVEPSIAQTIRQRWEGAKVKQSYCDLLIRIAGLAVICLILFTQVFLIMPVNGMGMFPNLKDGDIIIAFRLVNDFQKDDVLVYDRDGVNQVGRLVGQAGDEVDIDVEGNLYLNGVYQTSEKILYPTFLKGDLDYPVKVQETEFFVLGDYRTQALDSRDYGCISQDNVKGKVITAIRRRGL